MPDADAGLLCGAPRQDPVLQTGDLLGPPGKGRAPPFIPLDTGSDAPSHRATSTGLSRAGQVFRGKDGPLTLDWNRVRVFDRDVGQMFVNMAKTSREAQVRLTNDIPS